MAEAEITADGIDNQVFEFDSSVRGYHATENAGKA